MTVYFPTTPVVRTTTEGNLHFYRNALVEYRERGTLVQRLLNRPGHFWLRQDGRVTIRPAGGTLKGAADFRLIGGLDHGGHLTDGALGERPNPVLHFLNTDTEQRLIGSDYRDQHLRTCDIPQDKGHRIRLILAVMRGYRTPEGNRLRLREAANEVDRILGI